MYFNCCAAYRDLQSFPTRRSSDLNVVAVPMGGHDGVELAPGPLLDVLGDVHHARLWHPFRETARRSEEHTSELQSLRHLVCRLLLENKKSLRIISLVELYLNLCFT